MEFRKVRALRGPNIWANFPVLEAWVDLGDLNDKASDEVAGFNERLMAWLPTMIEHRCSVGERGGFFERLRRGTYPAHILEHVALELQCLAGTEVGFGKARAASEERVYKVAVEYGDEELGRACLDAARELVLAALYGRPYDVGTEVARLRELGRRVSLDPGTAAIVRAAKKRNIPVQRLSAEGLIQLGHGVLQRRLLAARTDRTGALAESIARDNQLTRTLLGAVGVPVPDGRPVVSAADAWEAAQELGLPVVVCRRYGPRPVDGGSGLLTREQVLAAYQAAAEETSSILAERFPRGASWQLLIVGGRLVSAVRRGAGPVSGANGQAGPRPLDITDDVHPDVADRAVEAAQVVGLDIAGVHIVAGSIGLPLEEQGGVVVGVTVGPDLGPHLQPASAGSRPVAGAILSELFPEDQTGRIPVVAVTGVNGKTTTTRLIAHVVSRAGRCVGMTCTEGIYIGGRRIEAGDCSGPRSAQAVLQNPQVEAAVFETARGGILRAGLGFDKCDVAVVTNIGEGDHLGIADIETVEQLAAVKRTVVEAVARDGVAVLKAGDPLVEEMAEHCRGSIVFFARDGNHPTVMRHRGGGGRAVFTRDNRVILADGAQEIPLVSLDRVPLTHGGRVGFQVENALAAAAAAWALGIPCEVIMAGLETFASDLERTPGRFNVLEVRGATVIMDYGHNVSSLKSLIETLEELPHRRRSAVYSAAGDRRDCDLVRQAELLADAFDHVILFEEDNCIRGRKPGEIFALFRQGLAGGSRVKEIHEVQGAVRAAEVAIRSAAPGELILIQVDLVDETIDLVRRYQASGGVGSEMDLRDAAELTQAVRPPEAVAAGV